MVGLNANYLLNGTFSEERMFSYERGLSVKLVSAQHFRRCSF